MIRDRLGYAPRLVGVDARGRLAGGHRAEAAAAGADVAEDHEGRGAVLAPALVDVGAPRLFADGVEPLALDQAAHLVEALRRAQADAQPGRTALRRRGQLDQGVHALAILTGGSRWVRAAKSSATSSAGALWVSHPTERRSTPVAAIAAAVAAVIPPEASSTARPAGAAHRLGELVDREVVEQDEIGAERQGLLELLQRVDLDLDLGGVARRGARPLDRLGGRRRRSPRGCP